MRVRVGGVWSLSVDPDHVLPLVCLYMPSAAHTMAVVVESLADSLVSVF